MDSSVKGPATSHSCLLSSAPAIASSGDAVVTHMNDHHYQSSSLPFGPMEPLHDNSRPPSSSRPNPPTCKRSSGNEDVVIDLFSPPVFSSPFSPYPSHCDEPRVTLKQSSYTIPPPISPIKELALSPREYIVHLNSPVTMSNSPKHSESTPLKHQTNPFKMPNSDLCSFPSPVIANDKNSYHSFSDANSFAFLENWKENFNKASSTPNNSLENPINDNNPTHNLTLGKSYQRDNSPLAIQNAEVNQGEKPLYLKASSLVCSPPYTKMPSPKPIVSQKTRGRWVRPLGYAEKFMSKAHEYGCMATIYAVWLNSKRPIPFNFIKQATSIMFRKMPHLRLVLGHHRGDRWWREMETEKVDVEELISSNIDATMEDLLKRKYRMDEGPLWFVRFITVDPEIEKDPCSNSEIAKYKYVCIFGFHHNITDGTTNMKFCTIFLNVLNCMMEGKDIDMQQEGYFAEPLHDRLADAVSNKWHLFLIFIRRFYKGMLSYGAFVRNFTRHYRMPIRCSAATNVLHHELDESTTERLLQRCKKERVTLNSAFITASNLAIHKMITAKDPSVKSSSVNSLQAINMRRYWPKDKQPDTFGCHISILDVSFVIRPEHFNCFWDCARLVHATILHQLNETRHPLIVQPISERLRFSILANRFLNRLRLPSTNDNHYCVTNMGDLSTVFPGTGPVVEASKILRSVSCHFMPSLCQHTIHTFKGKLSYSLDYYIQKMSKETATTYVQEILNILRSSIDSPN